MTPEEQTADAVKRIVRFTAHHYGVTMTELLANDKSQPAASRRHVAMWLCRQNTDISYPQLGRLFDGRDHATIMYGVKRVNRIVQTDTVNARVMRADITAIQTRLNSGHASPIVAALSDKRESVPA